MLYRLNLWHTEALGEFRFVTPLMVSGKFLVTYLYSLIVIKSFGKTKDLLSEAMPRVCHLETILLTLCFC